MKKLPSQLFELLSIHSPSREEWEVVDYMLKEIGPILDTVEVDDDGNIYGEIRMGLEDYTVLLSAHMDTVAYLPPKPYWKKDKKTKELEIHTSSKSALGGDDKCGLAVNLAVLRNLKNSTFTGTIKVLFSVEEEVGCVGASNASKLRPEWFKDVKCSIVVDRRGGSDIVTGMSYSNRFCSTEYGEFWEKMADATGFTAKVTSGTISDTMIFSEEFGINGVNISAGYYNPHSAKEYVKVQEVVRTAKWVLTALDHIQGYTFPAFEYRGYDSEDWFDDYYRNRTYSRYYTPWREEKNEVPALGTKRGHGSRKEDYFTWDVMDEKFIPMTSCDFCWLDVQADEAVMTVDKFVLCPDCSPHAGGGSRYRYSDLEYAGSLTGMASV